MKSKNNARSSEYILFILGIMLLSVAGYSGYALYPRFALPGVTGAGLFVIAAMAGVASFFSPCSFPLLATLLARSIGSDGTDAAHSGAKQRGKVGRAVRYGAALSLGVGIFLILTGVGIGLGGGALFKQITFTSTAGRGLRFGIGLLLILLGLVQIGRLSFPFGRIAEVVFPLKKAQARLRKERPFLAFGLFGFSYVLAGFG